MHDSPTFNPPLLLVVDVQDVQYRSDGDRDLGQYVGEEQVPEQVVGYRGQDPEAQICQAEVCALNEYRRIFRSSPILNMKRGKKQAINYQNSENHSQI